MSRNVVAERIRLELHSSSYHHLKRISVTFDEERITLSGTVARFYHRQLAIAEALRHADHVLDCIQVDYI